MKVHKNIYVFNAKTQFINIRLVGMKKNAT